jgi:hypothetical protein
MISVFENDCSLFACSFLWVILSLAGDSGIHALLHIAWHPPLVPLHDV